MKTKIQIISVKQVEGVIHPSDYHNYATKTARTATHYEPIALFIDAIDLETNNMIKFYSPTVLLSVTTGWLFFKDIPLNDWFELIETNIISAKGLNVFDGGDTPNVAIKQKSEIVPKIKVGDNINISYSISKTNKINRVKIL